jgi:predicted tellurium resistance membrane protein TerC
MAALAALLRLASVVIVLRILYIADNSLTLLLLSLILAEYILDTSIKYEEGKQMREIFNKLIEAAEKKDKDNKNDN